MREHAVDAGDRPRRWRRSARRRARGGARRGGAGSSASSPAAPARARPRSSRAAGSRRPARGRRRAAARPQTSAQKPAITSTNHSGVYGWRGRSSLSPCSGRSGRTTRKRSDRCSTTGSNSLWLSIAECSSAIAGPVPCLAVGDARAVGVVVEPQPHPCASPSATPWRIAASSGRRHPPGDRLDAVDELGLDPAGARCRAARRRSGSPSARASAPAAEGVGSAPRRPSRRPAGRRPWWRCARSREIGGPPAPRGDAVDRRLARCSADRAGRACSAPQPVERDHRRSPTAASCADRRVPPLPRRSRARPRDPAPRPSGARRARRRAALPARRHRDRRASRDPAARGARARGGAAVGGRLAVQLPRPTRRPRTSRGCTARAARPTPASWLRRRCGCRWRSGARWRRSAPRRPRR